VEATLVTAPKAKWFYPFAALLLLTDCGTKQLAVQELAVEHVPHAVIGDAVRFTLVYNRGAAFSFHLGDYSRVVFSVVALVMIAVLWRLYREANAHDRLMGAALGLIVGGAMGNLADRLRSPRGVVDFIDVGLGDHRFWVFNLADAGVSIGAAILLYLMMTRPEHATPPMDSSPPAQG
jgi:signal peptidase II